MKKFQQITSIPIDILLMKPWVAFTIFTGFILSLIASFFYEQVALTGLSFFILMRWIAEKYPKEIADLTVRQLTEMIASQYYSKARRQTGTLNRKEKERTIQDVFIADFYMRREDLRKEAILGWESAYIQ